MVVAIDAKMRNMDGSVIPDTKGNEATLKGVVVEALLAQFEDERQLSGEDKLKRYQLAMKVNESEGVCEMTAEEIALVKKLIGKAYGPLVSGQAWTILETKVPLSVVKEDV